MLVKDKPTHIISILSGIEYERKGAKSTIQIINSTGEPIGVGDVKLNFNYISIPILFSLSTNGNIRFYGRGGTFIGFC